MVYSILLHVLSGFKWVFMHTASDECKKISGKLMKQNLSRKIARLLGKNCPTI